jgi:hypothetical protein
VAATIGGVPFLAVCAIFPATAFVLLVAETYKYMAFEHRAPRLSVEARQVLCATA